MCMESIYEYICHHVYICSGRTLSLTCSVSLSLSCSHRLLACSFVRVDISPSSLYIHTTSWGREREKNMKHTHAFYVEHTLRHLSLSSLGACRYSIWQMLKLYSVLSRRMFGIVVHCCCVVCIYLSCGSRCCRFFCFFCCASHFALNCCCYVLLLFFFSSSFFILCVLFVVFLNESRTTTRKFRIYWKIFCIDHFIGAIRVCK